MTILSQIERVMKYYPKIFKFNIRSTIILNSFDYREFSLLNPIYKLLWTIFFVSNFIDFSIKEVAFCSLDCSLESSPVF